MQFRTSTFEPSENSEKKDEYGTIFFLLTILFLVGLIISNQLDLPFWISFLLLLLSMGFGWLSKYHNVFEKEEIHGAYIHELILSNTEIKIDDIVIDFNSITKIQIIIGGYEGKATNFSGPMYSQGTSNHFNLYTANQKHFLQFRIGTKQHQEDLEHIVKELQQNGLPIELKK